jgi:hypothetical protein
MKDSAHDLPNSPENQFARFFPPILGVNESTLSVSLSLSLSLSSRLCVLLFSGVCELASNVFVALDETCGKVMPRGRVGGVFELSLSRLLKLCEGLGMRCE